MLYVKKKRWFKVCAGVTAAFNLWFASGALAQAETMQDARLRSERLSDVTLRLGIDPARVTDRDAWARKEASEAARRREASLARLAERTSVGRGSRERQEATRRSIDANHRPALLAGLGKLARETGEAAAAQGGREHARGIASRRAALNQGLTRLGAVDEPLSAAVARLRRLQGALVRGTAVEIEKEAPARRRGEAPDTGALIGPRAKPPEPRRAVKLGATPSIEQREFYASVLDASGLEIESDLGLLDPILLATGAAPSMPLIASLGSSLDAGVFSMMAAAMAPPTEEDLGQDSDTRATAEIRKVAEQLQGDPIALYGFVHDLTDAEPYYGVKKGAAGALATRSGNDADLSALLVTLLRASGFPARFEYGTVDLSPEQAMAWAGTRDPSLAADALETGGIPTTILMDGSRVKAVRIEHVWVRAYVPYSNYRGVSREGSRSTWVRLDPTVKRARIGAAVDLGGRFTFDYAKYLAGPIPRMPLDALEEQLRAHVAAQGLACRSLADLVPTRERIPDGLTVLPAEVPAPVLASLATFTGFPASMRHTATVTLGGWTATLDLPAIHGAAITLRYRGASAADDAAIAQAGGIAGLAKPYAVSIVPTLTLDGVERGRGAAVLPGTSQEMTVTVSIPHGSGWTARHRFGAGGVYALALSTGRVADSILEAREAELRRARDLRWQGDDLEAVIANRAVWRYQWASFRDAERLLGYFWLRPGSGVSEAIAGREVESDDLYGTPVSIRAGRYVIDVSRVAWNPYRVDVGSPAARESAYLSLWQGSAWEHRVWEEVLNGPAISTVRILQVARSQGVNLLELDGSKAGLVSGLPYSQTARTDILDGLHAGRVVLVPERPITWGTYANREGYVLRDPMTGSAAFRLGGTLSGGESTGGGGSSSAPDGPVCKVPCGPASSTVGLSIGNMFFSETDLTVPARGIPVTFARRYDSMSPYGGRLGPGWQHSYEARLVVQPDFSVLFVNDSFRTQRFLRAADGSYSPEPGFHESLAPLPDGWVLAFQDGLEYRFRMDGQLRSIQSPNDHLLQLRYDTYGRLEAVLDSAMRQVLSFTYDGAGLLQTVTALDGRTVSFGHEGGDLVAVTDVLGGRQEYGYDSAHRLAWKKDRNGNVVQEFYDGEGRWIGGLEPDGRGRRVAYDMVNRRALHTDKLGNSTIWEYSERGNPVAVTDPLGNRRTLEWNDRHDKLADVDARGYRTAMTYDTDGNLLTRTDPLSSITSYTYGAAGRVVAVRDPAGRLTTNEYDDRGNLLATNAPTGARTEYAYTGDGLPETITQPGGAATKLTYRSDGTVESLRDPAGGTTLLGYDAFGHIETVTDPRGSVRRMASDAAGRIRSMTDATGAKTTFEYAAEGNRTAVVDSAGSRTTFGYDTLNRLVTVTDGAGKVTRTEYDPEGNVTARVDALGRRTQFKYDAAGRLVETVDAAGGVTTQGYCADVGSQPCGIVDPLGNLTTVQFDALGRATKTIDASGRVAEEHYDPSGRRDWSKDAAGRVTGFGYDDAGRLTSVTDPLGGVTTYGYDARGNRTSVTDANGKVTTFAYDLANRLLSETNPIGKTTSYEYDLAGNRQFKVDGTGARTEYFYDANRRLTKVLFADGTSYDFAYDVRGNRILEQSPTHRRAITYDGLGRPETVVDGGVGRTITYGYDALGNRTSMALDTGEKVQYRWDATARLSEVIDPQGEVTRYRYDASGRRSRVEYGNRTAASWVYDAAGQVLSIVYANQAGDVLSAFGYGYDAAGNRTYKGFADGTKEYYGHDALNRLTTADYPGGRHVEYGYDGVGNRISQVDTGKAPVTRWAVSARASSQVTTSGPASAAAAAGAPDLAGCTGGYLANHWVAPVESYTTSREEWLELTYAQAERARAVRIHETMGTGIVMRVDLIEENGTAHTVYEGGDKTACGNWLSFSFPLTSYKVKKVKVVTRQVGMEAIDAVGLDVQPPESYQYNGFNQLLSVTGPSGTTSFGYDGNGNQVSKVDPSGTTAYAYNYDNRLVGIAGPTGTSAFEYDANGLRTKKRDSTGTRSYLLDGLSVVAEYAPDASKLAWYTQSLARIDEVLSVVNSTGKYWYESDALGSTYAMTNGSGVVVSRSSYDVLGERSLAAGIETGQPFGFTGREHEAGSGLVYARARYLNPATGRWDRPDPLGLRAGPNRYAYVRARPTYFIDPLGLDTEVVVWDPVSNIDEPGSRLGHVSVRVNQWSYSWESGGMKPKTLFADYRQSQRYRSGTGYVLPSTPEHDKKVEEFLRNATAWYVSNATVILNVYNLVSRNCAQAAGIALNQADLIPPGPILFPSDLHRILRAKATSTNRYEQTEFGMTIAQWVAMSIQDSVAAAAALAF